MGEVDASAQGSALFTETQSFVQQEYERIRRNKVDPWALFCSGLTFRCTDFYGREIAYQGVEFEGSPREVFWSGFIEPFLKDLAVRTVDRTAKHSGDRGISARLPLLEAGELLKGVVASTYGRMQNIDQRLRAAGYPERAAPRDIRTHVVSMNEYVDSIVAGRSAPRAFWARLSAFYRVHPFVFWAIGIVVSVLIAFFL